MRWEWIWTNHERVLELAWAHVNLSWPAVVASFLLALPVGWCAHRYRPAREVLVVATGLLYVIPSLALFVVMPLALGTSILSPFNVVVAMTLYGLALQVRTAADAFDTVPGEVRQAAVAMGYPAWRRVLTVDLPLAGPVLLSGIRVVSASTISLVSVGALIGVSSLGTLFTEGFQRSFPTEIIAGLLGTVVLAVIFDAVLVAVGRLTMPWTRTRTRMRTRATGRVR
ncbi:ABC transporter permease [Corynebacterium halotolerans]|uniref:ABC transporter, permease protein n=1 Tax=Corynebacterium halotolerans YIM 70093 = DSM 44683 TaxID=1121362 RepID=M1N0U5_9CORY|nr:ABC transporter permease subunit [Corynebacterium halotolerans]AGF73529.1 ABC transporter, permease protein [Corynebacterium halotolerans YIM 70093 = DSM 44683]